MKRIPEREALKIDKDRVDTAWNAVFKECLSGKIDRERICQAMTMQNMVYLRILSSQHADILNE